MVLLSYVLVGLVAAVVGGIVVRANQTQAPAPQKPRFGLVEAENTATQLNGFTQQTATTTRVIAAVMGLEFGLPEDVRQAKDGLDRRESQSVETIQELEAEITAERATIAQVQTRRQAVNALAGPFGL